MNKTAVAQRAKTSSILTPTQGILQRKCACGKQTVAGGECAECKKKENSLQRKLTIGASNDPNVRQTKDKCGLFTNYSIHSNFTDNVPNGRSTPFSAPCRSCSGDTSGTRLTTLLDSFLPVDKRERANRLGKMIAGKAVGVDGRWLSSKLTNGRSLDPHVRSKMEDRFETDLSGVRIHTDQNADIATRTLNANALTVGQNIAFADGQFDPASEAGQRLLAHELAHAVQQKNVRDIPNGMIPITKPSHASEREAYTAVARFAKGSAELQNQQLSATVSPQVSLSTCGIIVEASCWAAFSAIAAAIAALCTVGSVITVGGLAIPCTAVVIASAGLAAWDAVMCTNILKDAICGEHNVSTASQGSEEPAASSTATATQGA